MQPFTTWHDFSGSITIPSFSSSLRYIFISPSSANSCQPVLSSLTPWEVSSWILKISLTTLIYLPDVHDATELHKPAQFPAIICVLSPVFQCQNHLAQHWCFLGSDQIQFGTKIRGINLKFSATSKNSPVAFAISRRLFSADLPQFYRAQFQRHQKTHLLELCWKI